MISGYPLSISERVGVVENGMPVVSLFEEAARLEAANRPFAIASILSARGSIPRNSGRMLIREDGSSLGSVGGGPLELYVMGQAMEALEAGVSRCVDREHLAHGKSGAGIKFGGSIEVHIDVVRSRPRLLLIGGGHVNTALAEAAAPLGYDIALVENRSEFAQDIRFPMARSIHRQQDTCEALREAGIDADTAVVIATSDDDPRILDFLLQSNASYIGMLGSKHKVALALSRLREEGYSEERIRAVHAPVGIDIGAETPQEIAVSILAELLMFRQGRTGGNLKGMVQDLVLIRGVGELGTACAWRLRRAGFRVVATERASFQTDGRDGGAFVSALSAGETVVEGLRAVKAADIEELYSILESGDIPLLADPDAACLEVLKPAVVLDATGNQTDTPARIDMAPIVLGLGNRTIPGEDVHARIGTGGESLGRVFFSGEAEDDSAALAPRAESDTGPAPALTTRALAVAGGVLEAILLLRGRSGS